MSTEKFEMHCVVELFGHARIAGKVTEQAIGGATFIRVDVPKTSKREAFTRFYGAGAIYSITPVDEQIAGLMAEQLELEPVSSWTLSLALRQKLLADHGDDEEPTGVYTQVTIAPLVEDEDDEDEAPDPMYDEDAWDEVDDAYHRAEDKSAAVQWARDLLAGKFVILDTETTGKEPDDEIVQIGIIDQDGTVLLDELLKPAQPIPPEATAIHHITDEMIKDARTFLEAYPRIKADLDGRRVVAYNREFDLRMLAQECQRHQVAELDCLKPWAPGSLPPDDCTMNQFAAFFGEWNDYHGNYRWQKLSTALRYFQIPLDTPAHSAISDCQATLAVIRKMAEYEKPRETN